MSQRASPYDGYIICTAPRSGSTLLCKLIAATGVAGNPRSYFHEPSLTEWCKAHGVDAAGRKERAVLQDVFAAAKAAGRGQTPYFGLRLQRRSVAFFEQKLAVLCPDAPDTPSRIKAVFGRVLYIRLHRADVLDQAISFVKAQQTGLWHRARDGSELERLSPPAPPRFDFAQIDEVRREFRRYNDEWDMWFKQHGIAPLEITYDGLSAAPSEMLARVLGALGVDEDVATDAAPSVARLSDEVNASWKQAFLQEIAVRGDDP